MSGNERAAAREGSNCPKKAGEALGCLNPTMYCLPDLIYQNDHKLAVTMMLLSMLYTNPGVESFTRHNTLQAKPTEYITDLKPREVEARCGFPVRALERAKLNVLEGVAKRAREELESELARVGRG